MTKFWIMPTLALAFAALAVSAFAGDDEDLIKARKAVLDLAKAIEKGEKDVAAKAAAVKKGGVELEGIMHSYKPADKKGIGFVQLKNGQKPKAGDGIELKFLDLGKRVSKMNLANEKADLIRMAYINLAIAELTIHYAPEKLNKGKGPKEWKQYTEEMKTATNKFLEAVKSGDPAKVKAAANDVSGSCNNCHGDFRDI